TGTGKAIPGGRLGAFRVARAGRGPAALSADADTTLLVHFDGDASAGEKKKPDEAKGLRYEAGLVGKGALVEDGAELRYKSKDVLDAKAGTVEFWLRTLWDGNSGKPHVFFQAGEPFNNGLLLQIDGANNIRLMTWGDNPATAAVERDFERGVGVSGSAWKAG